MPNELEVGGRRTGDLIDFDPDTPAVKVTLERTEQGISVEVPWTGSDDYYASWFLTTTSEIPSASTNRVPKILLFQDSHGSVLLVDCWPRGFHSNFTVGTGRVWAKHALLGVDVNVDFLKVNGLRSSVTGLREWLRVTSITEDWDHHDSMVTLTGKAAPPLVVNDALTMTPTWATARPDGAESVLLQDIVLCETRSETPAAWDQLIETHQGVRDLLVLSRWRAETCTITGVTRADDPLRTMDGAEHGHQWRQVMSGRIDEAPPRILGYPPHLIEFDEIGREAGIARWLTLRSDFSRAIDPVVSDRYINEVTPLTHVAQVGPGLEALGYLLLIRDGANSKTAERANLRTRLERIAADIDAAVNFDSAAWIAQMTSVYNAVKHANRSLPSELDQLNRWRESVTAMRAWVAVELGVAPAAIKERLAMDPTAQPFEAR